MKNANEENTAGSTTDLSDSEAVRLLLERYPLAWVSTVDGQEASLLPLVGIYDSEYRLIELIGHFARSNPLRAALLHKPEATILFTGPGGYISPSQAGRRNWGPTWNYAQLRVKAEISVESEITEYALDVLISQVEKNKKTPWDKSELGERYDLLLPQIVGFRAHIVSQKAKFKLGQDENIETLRVILSNLEDKELAWWMRRFNQKRLAGD